MTRPSGVRRIVLLVAMVLLASCSTAGKSDKAASGNLSLDTGTSAPGGAPGADGAAAPDPAAPAAAGSGASGAAAASAGGRTPAAAAQAGGGATAAPKEGTAPSAGGDIRVGLYYVKGTPGLQGAQGYALIDGLEAAKAAIKYIDGHGGFGGRRVSLSAYGVQLSDLATNQASQEQAACAQFTEDAKVAIAVQVAPMSENYAHCITRHNVVLLEEDMLDIPDQAFMDKYPGLVYQITPTAERVGMSTGDSLIRRNYFSGAGKNLGVVYVNTPRDTAMAKALLQRLAAANIRPDPANVIATDGSDSANQNAVIKLRSNNVTHVAVVFAWGFLNVAAAQGYYPRYALLKIPLQLTALNTARQALQGSIAIGWDPATDVERAQEGQTNAATQRCMKIMADAGITPGSRIADSQLRLTCDQFFWIKTAADQAQRMGLRDFSRATLRPAVEALGASFEPANGMGTQFGPGHHAGGELYKDAAYNSSCGCYEYQGGFQHFAR